MTKLHHLQISAFRGARFPLSLDFQDAKSFAIFGENASGKSTITDAIEWFIEDRIDHLWREGCKKEALRHTLVSDDDLCTVEIRFNGKDMEGVKSLSADLTTTPSFKNDHAESLSKSLKDDQIILRHANIVKFLDDTKSDKRKAIADIIGYEDITQFRESIQKTLNALKKDEAYVGAKKQSDSLQRNMINTVEQVVHNRSAFLNLTQEIVAQFNLETTITDEPSLVKAFEELRSLGKGVDKINAAQKLISLATICDNIKIEIEPFLRDNDEFTKIYTALAQKRERVDQIRLSDFLTKGHAVIGLESYTNDSCPFCLSPFDLAKLRNEVKHRLSEMEKIEVEFNAVKVLKNDLLKKIENICINTKTIHETYKELDGFEDFTTSANGITDVLRNYRQEVNTTFDSLEMLEIPVGFDKTVLSFNDECKASSAKAKDDATNLELTEIEQEAEKAISTLKELERQVREFERNQRIIDSFESQILTMSSIFKKFVDVQNSALQAVLNKISADVGAFYNKLHPNENVDNLHLTMVGEGVEFEYQFHGKSTQLPRKYLSESHLNSIGVVLFLANAKIFNKHAKFLILDDIVTSFDVSHRRRLLHLLKTEFSDWQILILTHENVWFDIIKNEMRQHNWLFYKIRSDESNGILLEDSPSMLREVI